MSHLIRCSWSAGPWRIPFRPGEKNNHVKKQKDSWKAALGLHGWMAGDQLAYVLPSMSLENFAGPSDLFHNHIPGRNETSSWPVSESYSYPWTKTKTSFLYVHAPRLGAQGRRPRGRKKIRPSDGDPMATDKKESCYFRVLNKIYLQNLLHGWVVNHELNLISRLNSWLTHN